MPGHAGMTIEVAYCTTFWLTGGGPACLNERPSASVAFTYCPPREPSFKGCICTEILSPGLTESGFQPCAETLPTPPISNDHWTGLAVFSSTATILSQACGVVHSGCLEVPESVKV